MQTNAILAVLAAGLAVPTVLTLANEGGDFTEFDKTPRLFPGFRPDTVHAVVLQKAADSEDGAAPTVPGAAPEDAAGRQELTLMRSKEGWVIGQAEMLTDFLGVPVRENKVADDILEHIEAMRRDERVLVATDADDEMLARRGLTSETGIRILCQNADRVNVAELYLGNDASGGKYTQDVVKGFFVRKEDRKDVVLYEPAASYWNLTLKPEDWIETKIQQFQTDQVTKFSMTNPKGEVSFTRPAQAEGEADNVARDWVAETTPDGYGAVRQDEVNGLVSRFGYVNVQRYISHIGRLRDPALQGAVPGDESSSRFRVQATLADGTNYTMWIGDKIPDKNEHYARFDGPKTETKEFLVAVGDWVVTGYEKEPTDLFDPLMPAEGSGDEEGAGDGNGEGGGTGQADETGGAEGAAPAGETGSGAPATGGGEPQPENTGGAPTGGGGA